MTAPTPPIQVANLPQKQTAPISVPAPITTPAPIVKGNDHTEGTPYQPGPQLPEPAPTSVPVQPNPQIPASAPVVTKKEQLLDLQVSMLNTQVQNIQAALNEKYIEDKPWQPGPIWGTGIATDYVKIGGVKYLEATFIGTKSRYLEIDKSTNPPTITWVGAMPDNDGPFKETFDTMKNHIHITGMGG
jgi:hypothetical protein